jgi:hypothetical protein
MKVKIPPYPNFIITNETLKKSDVPTVKKSDSEGLSNQLIMIIPFNENESRVLRARSIKHNGNTFISALPNPVHLFITLGIENYNFLASKSEIEIEKIKNEIDFLSNLYRKNRNTILVSENDVKVKIENYFLINTYLLTHLQKVDLRLNDFNYKISLEQSLEKKLNLCRERDSLFRARQKLIPLFNELTQIIFNKKGKSKMQNATLNWNTKELELKNKKYYSNFFENYLAPTLNEISLSDNPYQTIKIYEEISVIFSILNENEKLKNDSFFKTLNKHENRIEIKEYFSQFK